MNKTAARFAIAITCIALACTAPPRPVEQGLEIHLEYTASFEGQIVDASPEDGPIVFVVGEGAMKEAVEKELLGMKVGDRKTVTIPEAYGWHDPTKTGYLPKSKFTEGVEVGEYIRRVDASPSKVLEVREKGLIIDLNHALAGRTIEFELHVVDVRDPVKKTPAKAS